MKQSMKSTRSDAPQYVVYCRKGELWTSPQLNSISKIVADLMANWVDSKNKNAEICMFL
jgi:hypothetical protein